MRWFLPLPGGALFLILAVVTHVWAAGPAYSLLDKRIFKDADGKSLPYRLLKPADYDRKKMYPLVLFLHGSGERGTDNEKQLIHGVREFLTGANRKTHPCFLVVPQCPENARWVEVDWGAPTHHLPEKPSEPMRLVLELLPALQKEFRIDPRRLYVTGLSMGGFGTFDLLMRKPEWFAAGVPICGGADETRADRIALIPHWIFHGGSDTVVKTSRSRNIVAALKKVGGQPKYTEYPQVGHNSWEQTYRDGEMMKWLFAQKRKEKTPKQGQKEK